MEELTRDQKAEALASMLGSSGWQKVLKPAIELELSIAVQEWSSGKRTEADTGVSDEGLKQRTRALQWVLGWEQTYKRLLQSQEDDRQLAEATEPATAGGSIYE